MKIVGFFLGLLAFLFTLFFTLLVAIVVGGSLAESKPIPEFAVGLLGFGIFGGGIWGAITVARRISGHFSSLQVQERQRVENARIEAERSVSEQRSLQVSLTNHVSKSVQMASGLSQLAQRADRALDVAEREFAEGVFAPFWDAIESAVRDLATFTSHTEAIVSHARQHREEAPRLNGKPPQFQIGIDTLPDATHVAKRMQSIVRRAQKSFHFATIYEQRKTNQLLVAGFSNLAHAINDLGDRLDSSLEQLSSAVSVGFSDLASAQRKVAEDLQLLHEQGAQEGSARREHEEQEREMLDNIQRRRKPQPPKIGDGRY